MRAEFLRTGRDDCTAVTRTVSCACPLIKYPRTTSKSPRTIHLRYDMESSVISEDESFLFLLIVGEGHCQHHNCNF